MKSQCILAGQVSGVWHLNSALVRCRAWVGEWAFLSQPPHLALWMCLMILVLKRFWSPGRTRIGFELLPAKPHQLTRGEAPGFALRPHPTR